MRPHVFLITGFPGTGKLTVARALKTLLADGGDVVRLIDNHSINNVVFRLIENDGVTPLPPHIWERVGDVWRATLRTVEEMTPRAWHLIFTTYLDGKSDTGFLPRIEEVTDRRAATLIFVRLLCDSEENARRIVSPERRRLMKSIDPDEPHRLAALGPPYDPGHPNQLDLDVTALRPAAAAARIIAFARPSLQPQNP